MRCESRGGPLLPPESLRRQQVEVNPYLRPLYDALYEMVDTEKVEKLLERGVSR